MPILIKSTYQARIRKNMKKRLFSVVTFLFCLANINLALAAPLDFDGDGVSDTVTISRQNDNSANEIVFNTILSSTNESHRLEYGKRTDLLAPGDYNGDGIWEFGLIKRSENTYSWQIRNGSDDSLKNITFGQTNDIFLTGCNFDQDSATELSLIRESKLLFYNMSAELESSVELPLNSAMAIKDVFCADTTGDGISEIYFLKSRRINNRLRNRLYAYDYTGNKILDRRVQDSDSLFASMPNNESTYLIAVQKNKRQKSILTFIDNQKKIKNTLKLKKFNAATAAMRFNSANELQNTIVYMDETALYQHDYPSADTALLEFPVTGVELLQSSHRYFTGNNNPADPDALCEEIFPAKDGADGFLWKQSDFHPGVAVIFPASYSNAIFQNVEIIKDGESLDILFFAGVANGNRQHWRSHKRASSFPDNSIIVASRGTKRFCWQIEDSASRND